MGSAIKIENTEKRRQVRSKCKVSLNGHTLTGLLILMRSSSISAKAVFILRQVMTLKRAPRVS